MADPTPIRPGVRAIAPQGDSAGVADLKAMLALRVDKFLEQWNEEPHTYALVLTGESGRSVHTLALPGTGGDRLATCGAAALLLSAYGLAE